MKATANKLLFPVLLIVAYLLMQPKIFGSKYFTFAAGGDQHLIVNPIISFASKYDAFTDPLIRLWNGSFDLYHSPLTNLRYPFYFLWAGDTGDIVSTSHYAFLLAHFHHVIGGLGAFVLARVIGVRPLAAFAGAMFFMFCFNNTLLSPFYWRLASTAWTPFALAGVWLIATGKSPKQGILLSAPAIALLVFAKSTQPLAYFAYLAFFFGSAGFLSVFLKQKSVKDLYVPALSMSILVGISILLCFPVLYPVIEHQSEYIRWTTDGPIRGFGNKVSYEATQQFAYPLHGIWNVLVPLPKMFSIGSTFLGAAAVGAIAAAWFSKSHRILVAILSFVIVYFVVNGFGDALKLTRLTYKLPVLSSVRQLTSHYIFVVIAASVLIAIGFDTILSMKNRKARIAIMGILSAIIVAALIGLTSQANFLKPSGQFGLSAIALILSPVLFGGLLFVKSPQWRNGLAVLCIVLMVLPASQLRTDRTRDLTINNVYYSQTKTQDTISAWEAAANIKPGALVSSFVKNTYPEDTKKLHHYHINSLALYAGLRPFNVGYTPRPYDEFKHFNRIQGRPGKSILRGSEFLLTDQDVSKIKSLKQLKKVGTFGQLELYQVIDPYLRGGLECLTKSETKNPELLAWCAPQKNYSDVRATKISNTSFAYSIEPDGQTYLKHWGWANGGWKAKIDGQLANIIPIGADRIAVKIKPGDKDVVFRYMPKHYAYSWPVFILGLLAWFAVLMSGRLGRWLEIVVKRRRKDATSLKA